MTLFGGIEAGGTKFGCVLAEGPEHVIARAEFPTTTPEQTIGRSIRFFRERAVGVGELAAIGIASFGPVDLDPSSSTYGYITHTPKPGWSNVDFAGWLRREFNLPVGFDTDVNGAALAELRWGAAQGLHTLLYLTIGTGIGGGGFVGGAPMHGLVHPEMGHMRLPHDWEVDPFAGNCPFHGDCFEGLASGPAIEKRWGMPAARLGADHPAWALEALYLSYGLVNLICTLSPQKLILGGGVMRQTQLFPLIWQKVPQLLAGYVQNPLILKYIERYIVPPALGSEAGVLGAVALAMQAFQHD